MSSIFDLENNGRRTIDWPEVITFLNAAGQVNTGKQDQAIGTWTYEVERTNFIFAGFGEIARFLAKRQGVDEPVYSPNPSDCIMRERLQLFIRELLCAGCSL